MKKLHIIITLLIISMIYAFLFFSCKPTRVSRNTVNPDQIDNLDPKSNYLKIHMKDGSLYILDKWFLYEKPDTIRGIGNYYDQNRKRVTDENQIKIAYNYKTLYEFHIPRKNISLVETNRLENIGGDLGAISIVGVPLTIVTIYCLINPKACFGSCPTFYAFDGDTMTLMAEGFSSSILPTFEKRDIDNLYFAEDTSQEFQVSLTNEALETHVIRYVDLMAVPIKDNERVFASEDNEFYKVSKTFSPSMCMADEGDCLELIKEMDHQERFSESDPHNLAKREIIEFTFNNIDVDDIGLIIGSRQTLLTTYLFYQSMAYAGNMYGTYAAKVESGDKAMKKRIENLWNLLGGIEILTQNARGKWVKIGEVEEMGPIASDVHIIKLPKTKTTTKKFKLRLTKGLWRIDYLALAKIEEEVEPIRIKPSRVIGENGDDKIAKSILHDTLKPLITFPGDQFQLIYQLPDRDKDFELFLDTKGYYIEWMRDEWLAEEDQKMVALMFTFPALYMRLMAPAFKEIESSMEENFWGSRYVKN